MNLSSDTQAQDASSACNTSAAASTPRASVASTHPSPARVNTKVAMTVTPATAGVSAVSMSSRSSSYHQLYSIKTYPSVSQDSLPDSTMSTYIHPSGPSMPRRAMSTRTFSERSPSPHTRSKGAMAEAMSVRGSPSPGIMRRLSRGASHRLRRRASTTHSLRLRDQSAGPVLMRRRSESNGASDIQDVSDLELDSNNDELEEGSYRTLLRERTNPSGTNASRPSMASSNAPSTFEGGIAPAMSAILENGTWLTKVTKRRQKRIKLRLDSSSARVCWHTSNPSKSFFIDDVREVRIGADSRNARDDIQIQAAQEDLWVSILYDVPERSKGRTIKSMHVLMPDMYVLRLWTEALDVVMRERAEIMHALSSSKDKAEKSMAMAWKKVMARKDVASEERLTLDDARWICRMLEINCSDSAVKTHFKHICRSEDGALDYQQYRKFVESFRERKDITHIFRNMAFGTDLDMDLQTFLDFLRDEQKIDVDRNRMYWESVFDRHARTSQNRPSLPDAGQLGIPRVLTPKEFQKFLTSSYGSALATTPSDGEPNLDRPLNEYFISSSHNTYLVGRQVAGVSSVEGYIQALYKGCRCLEIDCWNGKDGRPMVTHGKTMTTEIPFEDCVSVIAKFAFNTSPYPLIISLEVHCNAMQQLEMVELMKRYFGSMMITEPLYPNSTNLPSPEELRNRILIKVKAAEDTELTPSLTETPSGRSRARSLTSTFTRSPSIEDASTMSSPLLLSSVATSPSEVNGVFTPRGSTASGMMTPSSTASESDEIPLTGGPTRKSKTSRIIRELGRLGVYAQGIKFGEGFHTAEAKTFNHIYSFNEKTFENLCGKNTNNKALLEAHNMRYLMRVYPAPKRVDSSNFNPLHSWRRGVQMAALNWQTFDVHQQVNQAMFAAGTDRLGYVLKPEELRQPKHMSIVDAIDQGLEKKEKKDKKLVKFSVDIISAQRLPRPRNQTAESGMNPYIEFELFSAEDKARGAATGEGGTDASARDGTSGIGSPLRKRTRIVEGNGFDPQYYQNISMAVETKIPDLIFVRWTVWHAPEGKKSGQDGILLACSTAKLSNLQQGYRHLPLFNPRGEQYRDAQLFVKIKKEAAVALYQESGDTAYYGSTMEQPTASPRMEPLRPDRSWRRKVFSRAQSQRRKDKDNQSEFAGGLSRTSSMDRESMRS